MPEITVKLSPEMAKRLLSFAETDLADLQRKAKAKEEEVAELKRAIQGTATTEPQRSLPLSIAKNPESARARRGESKKVILASKEWGMPGRRLINLFLNLRAPVAKLVYA